MIKITYQGFSEDSTKSPSLDDVAICTLIVIFEEAVIKCREQNITEVNFQASEFIQVETSTIPDFNIRIVNINKSDRELWKGIFAAENKKFTIHAQIV
jgi:hypothetical protein